MLVVFVQVQQLVWCQLLRVGSSGYRVAGIVRAMILSYHEDNHSTDYTCKLWHVSSTKKRILLAYVAVYVYPAYYKAADLKIHNGDWICVPIIVETVWATSS